MDDTSDQKQEDDVQSPMAPVEEIPDSITAEPIPDDGEPVSDLDEPNKTTSSYSAATRAPRSYRYTVRIRGRSVSGSYVNVDEIVINPGGQPVIRPIPLPFTTVGSDSQDGKQQGPSVPAGEKRFVVLLAHGKKGGESNAVMARVEFQG